MSIDVMHRLDVPASGSRLNGGRFDHSLAAGRRADFRDLKSAHLVSVGRVAVLFGSVKSAVDHYEPTVSIIGRRVFFKERDSGRLLLPAC